MASTVTLSRDSSALDGINLKWSIANLPDVIELTLIYYKNDVNADINSMDLDPHSLKVNLQNMESGAQYSFQIQAFDGTTTIYSNILTLTSPYFLSAPVINRYIGIDSGVIIKLNCTSNQLSSADTVEFVFKQPDNTLFWVIKNFASNGCYRITNNDDTASLVNNQSYRVACMLQPSTLNTRYSSPSSISNSLTVTPSNFPNIPQSISNFSVGSTTLDMLVSWSRPNDFDEWSSSGFSIVVSATDTFGNTQSNTLTNNETSHIFINLSRGTQYKASVHYVNSYGDGPSLESLFTSLTCVPDAPILFNPLIFVDSSCTITWAPPLFDGQSEITSYKVYQQGAVWDY
jgi:hypothetical protein